MTPRPAVSARDVPWSWRVTRYDPALRDQNGAYTQDTWTSISDVGTSYAGVPLTLDEYQRAERAYLEVARVFADEAGATQLQVRGVDSGPPELSEGAIITVDRAIDVLRLMLREDAICRLETSTNDFVIHAGFDLYMYIASARPCPQAATRAASLGLFVDHDFPSPQLDAE